MGTKTITALLTMALVGLLVAGPGALPSSAAVATPTTVTVDGPDGAQLQFTYDNPNYLYGERCESFTFTITGTSPTPQRANVRFTWTDPTTKETKTNGYDLLQLPFTQPLEPAEIGCVETGPGTLPVTTTVDWTGASWTPVIATSTVTIPVRYAKPRLILKVQARANVVQGTTELFGRAYTPDINYSDEVKGFSVGLVEAWVKIPGSTRWIDTDAYMTRKWSGVFYRDQDLPLLPEGTLMKFRYGCDYDACGPVTKIVRIIG